MGLRRNILIFGATSKIAHETARIWARDESSFILVGRNISRLENIRDDLLSLGAEKVEFSIFDFNNMKEHSVEIEKIFSERRSIDTALVAHGHLGSQSEAEDSWDHAEEILKVNFLTYASILLPLAAQFEKQGHGMIIVIGSVAGDRGRQSNYIYGSAKAAVERLCEGLRNRLFSKNVHVLLVKPGFVDTPMTSHLSKGPLFAPASAVAKKMINAADRHLNTIYAPSFWRLIMAVIRAIPESVFKRLKL